MMIELSFSVTRPFNKVCCQMDKAILILCQSAITTQTYLLTGLCGQNSLANRGIMGGQRITRHLLSFMFPLCILKMMLIIPHAVRLYELPRKQIAESHFAVLSEQWMLML